MTQFYSSSEGVVNGVSALQCEQYHVASLFPTFIQHEKTPAVRRSGFRRNKPCVMSYFNRVLYIYIGGYFAEYDVVPTCMTFYYPSKIALVRHQITCDPCCRVRRCRRLPLDWGGNGLVSIFCTPGYLTMTPESFKHGVDGRTRFRISLRTLSIMRTYQVRMLFCLFFPRDVAGGRACVTKKK